MREVMSGQSLWEQYARNVVCVEELEELELQFLVVAEGELRWGNVPNTI